MYHLVPNSFLSKNVRAQRLGGGTVGRILLHAIPEKSVQFTVGTLKRTHLLGLKRAPAMEDAREDFPPVPLPEPFLPPSAAPARLVRVPFKPALGQHVGSCGKLLSHKPNGF